MARINKYKNMFLDIEKKYEGQIVKILNDCKVDLLACEDLYAKNVYKYQVPIANKTLEKIYAIQSGYLKECETTLDSTIYKLEKAEKPKKNNVEQLLEAVNKSNHIEMAKMKYSILSFDELMELGQEVQDEIDLDIIKHYATVENNKLEDKQQMALNRISINQLKGYSDLVQLQEMAVQLESLKDNEKNLLPGVSLGDSLNIGDDIKGYIAKSMAQPEQEDIVYK